MKTAVTVALIATALCGMACSGNLTRSRAEEILRAKFPPSNRKTGPFYVSAEGLCFDQIRDQCGADAMPAFTKELETLGLISVAYQGGTARISITDKGRQYVDGDGEPFNASLMVGNSSFAARAVRVWISKTEFGAVTGISEPDASKQVTVEFTTLEKPTPFSRFNPVSQAGTATFKKYDDGWRLMSTH